MGVNRIALLLATVVLAGMTASAVEIETADGRKIQCTVVKVTSSGVVVKEGETEKTYAFDELSAKDACACMKETVGENDAEGYLRLGEYCLKRGLREEGQQALLTARRLKPELENEVNKVWAESGSQPRVVLTPEQVEGVIVEQRSRALGVEEAVGQKVHTLETEHFIIYTTFVKRDHRPIMRRCEQLYRLFDRVFEITKQGERMWDGKCVFYCFKERDEFVAFAQKVHRYPGHLAGGYFRAQGGQCEVVIPNLRGAERFEETMVHEGAHAFLHFYREPGRIPSWVHEGVAQYFQFESFADSAQLRTIRRTLREGVGTNDCLTLKELAGSRRPSSGADHVAYAYAWGYVRYLVDSGRKNGRFAKFIRALKAGEDAEKALVETYGWDFDGMQKHWLKVAARGL